MNKPPPLNRFSWIFSLRIFNVVSLFLMIFVSVEEQTARAQDQKTFSSSLDSSKIVQASHLPDYAFGAFQRGDYTQAFQEAMKRLQSNDKDSAAMTLLGELYRQGLGVKQDLKKALEWYHLASDLNNREAAFSLGLAYYHGEGCEKNLQEAKGFFEQAAQQGHSAALYNLGTLALETTPPDRQQALVYFQQAASQGDKEAQWALGLMYKGGEGGIEKNLFQAVKYLQESADQDFVPAQIELGIMLFNGQGVARNESKAAHYFLKAAQKNNPVAQVRLARLLMLGRGIGKDKFAAMRWYLMAQAQGLQDSELDQEWRYLSLEEQQKILVSLRKSYSFLF